MPKSEFLESVRKEIRLRGYGIRTEKSYLYWIKQFTYHLLRYPHLRLRAI